MIKDTHERERTLRELKSLSWVMDTAIQIPGTRIRLGADSLLGLIPGGGDAAGMLVSAYLLYRASQLGVSRGTLLRMAGNMLLDAAVGTIPIAGDVFDVFFKANRRNVRLLERKLGNSNNLSNE